MPRHAAKPARFVNPVTLAALGGVGVVRGLSYVAAGDYGLLELEGHALAPSLPLIPLELAGVVWLIVGIFFWAGLAMPRLFKSGVAIMSGAYATWALLHIAGFYDGVDWGSLLSLAVYLFMIVATITLGTAEVAARALQGGRQP